MFCKTSHPVWFPSHNVLNLSQLSPPEVSAALGLVHAQAQVEDQLDGGQNVDHPALWDTKIRKKVRVKTWNTNV